MERERWVQVKQILSKYLDLESGERASYLAQACASDALLLADVRSLLNSHDELGDFLETPIFGSEREELLAGSQIGNYLLREPIANGGMGTVYRAVRSADFEKQVAIKLVKRGMDTDFILRRFRHERQILAGLDHPNIARLLDGGATEDERPYLVMEYIEGIPITEYSEEHELQVPERLQLFRTVCLAVQYAHQHLVVHRDLKPSNILVTSDGVPKLLDFGIAKLLQPDAEATITSVRLMTPECASPEQVRGQPITTASDVYSLGVLLYQLVTGERPYQFTTRTPEEVARVVCETEPKRPSSVRRLADDLDNIVLKAMHKEPARRYVSAEQLAEDVRRYLEGLPVSARKDTFGYHTSKFIARHKAGVVAALTVAVILLGGMLVTLREARIAQRRFNEVRELANSLVFDIHDSIKDLPGATHAREVLVLKATQYLDGLGRESDKDPSLQRELGNAYEKLGSVQGSTLGANLGDSAGALRSYRKAQNIYERLATAGVTQDRLRYAQTGRAIATILWATSDTANALKTAQISLAITQALSTKEPDNQDVLVELAAEYVQVGDLMTTTNGDSSVLGSTNQVIDDNYSRALEIDKKLALGSSDPRRRRNLAVDELYIGRHFNDTGRWHEAAAAFNEALALTERRGADSNNNPQAQRDLAAIRNNLGDTLLMSGYASQAIPNYEEALRLVSANAYADPADSDAKALVAEAEMNIGNALGKIGKVSDALGHLRAATMSLAAAAQRDSKNQAVRRDLAISYLWSGRILANEGDFAATLEDYHNALATQKEIVRADPADLDNQDILAGILAAMGDFFQKRGQMASAEENYRQTLSLGESLLAKAPEKGEMRYVLAQAYLGLARVQMTQAAKESERIEDRVSQWSRARSLLERSSSVFRQIPHPAAVTTNGLDAVDDGEIRRALSQCDAALAKLTASTH